MWARCMMKIVVMSSLGLLYQAVQEKPVHPGGTGKPVQMQMGIEAGEVVEIDGDCYRDAVNSFRSLPTGQLLVTSMPRASTAVTCDRHSCS